MPIDPFELGTFVPVFDVVRAIPGVTMADALCYGVLASYRGKGPDGECRPSMARLARDLGADERDTRRRVQKLERLGLIERVERPGKPCIVNFLQPSNPGVKDPGVNTPGVDLPGVVNPTPPRGERPRGPRGLRPLQVDPRVDPQVERPAAAPPAPSLADQILELEMRYAPTLPAQARDACGLSRRNGKMADAVWHRTLTKLATYDLDAAQHAMQQMAERYGDGEKDEAYMLGIARRHKPQAAAPTRPAQSFRDRMAQEVVCES